MLTLVHRYAAWLMGEEATWSLAAAYLAWCPMRGAALLAALPPRLQVQEDAWAAQKALQLCRSYGLEEASTSVCRAAGAADLQEGRLASALEWFLAAGDDERAASVAARHVPELAAAALERCLDVKEPTVLRQLEDLEALLLVAQSPSHAQKGPLRTLLALRHFVGAARSALSGSPQDREAAHAALAEIVADVTLPAELIVRFLAAAVPLLEMSTTPRLLQSLQVPIIGARQ